MDPVFGCNENQTSKHDTLAHKHLQTLGLETTHIIGKLVQS